MRLKLFRLSQMSRNSILRKSIRFPVAYIIIATLSGVFAFYISDWFQAEPKKIVLSSLFLGGLYLLFYYVFLFLQKKYRDQSAFIFLIILMLKFVFIFAFLFLFLNPMEAENKRETLLFLMTYFVLLVADVAIKIRLMK